MDLEPGPELDQLIAEKIMGTEKLEVLFVNSVDPYTGIITTRSDLQYPPYSTDVGEAWKITEKMCNTWVLQWHDVYAQWHVRCDPRRVIAEDCRFEAWEHTAPHAICMAALQCVGAISK